MNIINRIVSKHGTDKALHFLAGAWLTAQFEGFGFLSLAIGVLVVYLVSYSKEKYMDSEFDNNDIKAAMIGCFTEIALYVLRSIL